jgi:Domain of unknown function (DUF222)/HNH endonuclease
MDAAASAGSSERPISDLADEITELAGHVNAANYRWLVLIAEFDRRQGWSDGATQSCAHWLNWKCGIDPGAAREKVRVAHALMALPKISAAMEKGQLSYSKVRALTRVACTDTESCLLEIALHGTAGHVEKLVRHYRRAKDAEELSREAAQQLNRACSYTWDDDGSLVLKARLPAEAGAVVLKALEAAMDDMPIERDDPTASVVPFNAESSAVRVPASVRRADALALVMESFVAHGLAALSGGDKHQIVVHVSAETLRNSESGRCEIENGPGICAETCRRLACDCSRVHITEDAQASVLDVGRKTRSIPPALRRAMNSRDQGCRFPGCCNSKYLDGHHIEHWAKGGATKLRNLVSLCRFHHRQVHEGGYTIEILDDGALRFYKPNGERLDDTAAAPSKPWRGQTRVDPDAAATRWRGEKMSYDLGVQILQEQAKRARATSRSAAASAPAAP